jgi:hypothetical protein
METADRALLEQWMRNWKDLVDFVGVGTKMTHPVG